MALSGTYYGSWLGSGYQRVYLEWSATQDIGGNTSTVTAVLKWQNSAGVALSSSTAKSVRVTIAGTTYSGTATVGIGANTTKTLLTATKTVGHNADGTLSISLLGEFDLKFTLSGTYYDSTSVSGSPTLDTIPRTSQASLNVSTQALGGVIRVNTNRASSVFTHNVYNDFLAGTWTLISSGVTDFVDWTIPTNYASRIPNSTSGSGRILVETYSGGTYIGAVILNFTATVPDNASYRPSISGVSVSISGSGRDKTIGKYVQNISKSLMSFTPTANGGANISSNLMNIKRQSDNGNSMSINSSSGTTDILLLSGVYIVTFTTTDSRGRSVSSTTTITVEAYVVPKITSFTANRQSVTKTNVDTVRSGTYTYMGGSNPLTVVVARAPRGGAFTNLNTTAGTTSGTFSGTYVSTGNLETASYEFKLTITDSFGNTASATLVVSTSSVALTIKKDIGIGVGKVWEQGALDVAGSIYKDGIRQGAADIILGINVDLNTVTDSGFYRLNSSHPNMPAGFSYGQMLVIHGSGDTIVQVIYAYASGRAIKRGGNPIEVGGTGTWRDWVEFVTFENITNTIYPVGAIYMSVVSTSPASLFGGTWVALGGQFLIGANGTYTAGSTGGSATHTLTEAQIPAHIHRTQPALVNAASVGIKLTVPSGTAYGFAYDAAYDTTSTGGGAAHNNMPPYLAVYMWKRTA